MASKKKNQLLLIRKNFTLLKKKKGGKIFFEIWRCKGGTENHFLKNFWIFLGQGGIRKPGGTPFKWEKFLFFCNWFKTKGKIFNIFRENFKKKPFCYLKGYFSLRFWNLRGEKKKLSCRGKK